MTTSGSRPWWQREVLYQIYTRSFFDSDDDGVGDLRGITARLDYLGWLGVGGIWLSPIHPSANRDWGYDVVDYRAVDPDYGSMADLAALVAEAELRGIKVLLDLVPNQTSSEHAWFLDARSSESSRYRDWYVWAPGRPHGRPPNNWKSIFGGPAWTHEPVTSSYYLHNFLPSQPDLNWWNNGVREEFERIVQFWLDRGVAGFRIDVCYGLIKDKRLRDNPPATDDDSPVERRLSQKQRYNLNRPEVHEILAHWRRIADHYDPPRVLIGETSGDLRRLAAFYGHPPDRPELHLALDLPFANVPYQASALRATVAAIERSLPTTAWPAWQLSSHDTSRVATRWGDGEGRKIRCALLILLTLRGTPVIYYGDELGMTDVDIDKVNRHSSARDEPRERSGRPSRLVARTPMQWTAGPNGGFASTGVDTWLPVGNPRLANVSDQQEDPRSTLAFCRDLLTLRRHSTDLTGGAYRALLASQDIWVWRRGEATVVVVNLSDKPVRVPGLEGRVGIGTNRARDGTVVRGGLLLSPWEGAVILS